MRAVGLTVGCAHTLCAHKLKAAQPTHPPTTACSAYTHHAEVLGMHDIDVDKFVAEAYAFLCSDEVMTPKASLSPPSWQLGQWLRLMGILGCPLPNSCGRGTCMEMKIWGRLA